MPTNDELVGYFCQHIVPVLFSLQNEQDAQNFVVTTFVLSVSGQWFLITAGHVLRDIEKLTDEHGYVMTRCQLIDSLGLGATHNDPVPFVYKDSRPTNLSDDYGFDYGVMVLSSYYKQLLEANKIQALNEEVWKKQPEVVDFHVLLGIPSELVQFNSTNFEIASTLHTIKAIDYRPEGFTKTDAPLFYGRIALGEGIHSIEGMSGGPVFAFHKNELGELRYWLIALQSSWLPKSHYIAACPTKLLGNFLEEIVGRLGEASS